jgi:3-isopropylmalate/(R)-2-methylmalate dehydratase large subunit
MAASSSVLKTLVDKIWELHVVASLETDLALLHVDRHYLHDLNGLKVLNDLQRRGLPVRNPELTTAIADHSVSTVPLRDERSNPAATDALLGLQREAERSGIRFFGIGDARQGIIHIVGPELGLTLPGATVVCGDSHTCTQGALGALAFGIGRSEVTHVLATQTLYQKKPKSMRVSFNGTPGPFVAPKDLVLHLVGELGVEGGSGYAVEYGGSTVRAMSMEGRMTICNLSIEIGAKYGLVAPDDVTLSYVHGRPFAPRGKRWEQAIRQWQTLPSDRDAVFERDLNIDASRVAPQITWGTSPQQVVPVDGRVPNPEREQDPDKRRAMIDALTYMDLEPGTALEGLPVDWVFIGSCTNGRIEDLRAAADVLRGRKVSAGVRAWAVPGSQAVRRAAESEGLHRIFRDAGFEWREPGCSMCLAANGETIPPHARSISTTNRNFEGRQGPLARTHLASPAMAAIAAVTGRVTDIRKLMH